METQKLASEPAAAQASDSRLITVLKFGGTSVKNFARIQHVAEIIKTRLREQRLLVVVSAMGDTTDYLLKLAHQASEKPDQRELDLLLSTGEQISITLLAMALRDLGIRARSFTASQVGIFTEEKHNKARIVDVNSHRLAAAFEDHDVIVVAGFQGVTASGDVTTLGRGGSDTTAVALAAAIKARVCDIYTDVDGIYTADPNVIKNAKLITRVSYDEVVEMARLGAQVIHPRAVELARKCEIALRVRNTFKPEHEGTTIDEGEGMEVYRTVSGVAVDKDQSSVCILDVPDKPGIAGEIMQTLADHNIVVDMIMQALYATAGMNTITFTVNTSDLDDTVKALETMTGRLGGKGVIFDPDIAKVSIIGSGIAGQPAVAAKLFRVLGENKINIKMIAGSEKKLTCVIASKEADQAARLIHDAFDLGN